MGWLCQLNRLLPYAVVVILLLLLGAKPGQKMMYLAGHSLPFFLDITKRDTDNADPFFIQLQQAYERRSRVGY
jgi:hypothetical protein